MRSTAASDVTMRTRIRDSAIELFGERGFHRATIREIAARAGASPGLVLHHFGSKDGLRDECDSHVLSTLLADRRSLGDSPRSEDVERILSSAGVHRAGLGYLSRMMTEPGAASTRVFDAFLEQTREMMRGQETAGSTRSMSNPDVTAVLVTAYGMAPLLLNAHIARVLGVDPLSPEGARLLALPGLELFTHGLYRDDSLLQATAEALARGMGPRADKGDGEPNQDPDPPAAATPSDPTS